MRLETERLKIRELTTQDIDRFYSYRSDPEVCRFQGFDPFTKDQSREFLEFAQDNKFGEPEKWSQHGIELKASGILIGDIGLCPGHDVRVVEFGISLSREHQGKGLAREALKAVFDHLFSERCVHRIVATVDTENAAIIRLLKKFNFRREGVNKESFFENGSWRDEYFYALLSHESAIAPGSDN